MNTDFKVKLTPEHEEPVYSQSLPTPTNLKDDLLVKLALMQEYGILLLYFTANIRHRYLSNGNLTVN